MSLTIRDASPGDADAICRIYNPRVEGTIITFEEAPVSAADMAERIAATQTAYPWLVAETEGGVAGYAYANRYASRASFRHSAECVIYVRDDMMGKGIATALYGALLPRLKAAGIHSVVAAITLPNPASVALHERCGFRKVGHLAEVGFKFGRWIDLGYWQIVL